jgi:hypothetical protein
MSKHTPVEDKVHPAEMGGTQKIYKFDNGHGASVVQFPGSYGYDRGLWELAVIELEGEDDWSLTYETPITSDVEGYLEWADVENLLDRISELDKP